MKNKVIGSIVVIVGIVIVLLLVLTSGNLNKFSPLCVAEGQSVAGIPTVPRNCCAGLNQGYVYAIENGRCIPAPGADFVCVKCGNGICGPGENQCNCPQDCGSLTTTTTLSH